MKARNQAFRNVCEIRTENPFIWYVMRYSLQNSVFIHPHNINTTYKYTVFRFQADGQEDNKVILKGLRFAV